MSRIVDFFKNVFKSTDDDFLESMGIITPAVHATKSFYTTPLASSIVPYSVPSTASAIRQMNTRLVAALGAAPPKTANMTTLNRQMSNAANQALTGVGYNKQEELRVQTIADLRNTISQFKSISPVRVSPPLRIPDYTSTLTTWRGWKIRNKRLSGLGRSHVWEPKVAKKAVCMPLDWSGSVSCGEAPKIDCSCGYWSFKSLDHMPEILQNYLTDIDVIGTVEIWGKVIECENGYRSEFAYPKELWLLKPGLEYLSYLYDVPMRKLESCG